MNERGQLMRGRAWAIQKVHKVLSNPLYRGEHSYNVIDARRGTKRPPSGCISVKVEPIIDAETFERVRQREAVRRAAARPIVTGTADVTTAVWSLRIGNDADNWQERPLPLLQVQQPGESGQRPMPQP